MNRLANESSPYLLQHAHNPVDWYAWGAEALQKAKDENKPILVSIGYAACHWCHVMERESFEDERTAALMNEHFVNIKIDREERPDLDHIYMDAVQALTGSGGWPLNVFLTPECKPFYGGTYFPPAPAYNRPSWKDVLLGVAKAFEEDPEKIVTQAETLTRHIADANSYGKTSSSNLDFLSTENLDLIYSNIMKVADMKAGGFGRAPKFPQSFTIQYLLSYYHRTKQQDALQQACLSLDKMLSGGIYDHAGGGFARYATDNNWLVPHFEKMLYDNALMVMALSEAYQLTHKKLYLKTIRQTIEYLKREMLSPEFGFYASLDADSEGEEGRYYVWSKEEIDALLGEHSKIFCSFYNVSREGNWEGKNILHITVTTEQYAETHNIPVVQLEELLDNAIGILLNARNKRIRPLLDDKILLGWNALMNTALSKAYAATGEEEYKELAIRNMKFLWGKFKDAGTGNFSHTFKNGRAKYPAFLDDYAYLTQALIHLQETTGEQEYLENAEQLAALLLEHFTDEDSGLFFFTHANQTDVVVRKKEVYDGATPSGNSIMAWNLLYLGLVFDRPEWSERVVKMLKQIADATARYPTSFGIWALVMQKLVYGVTELVITGQNSSSLLREILHIFMPHRVLQVSADANDKYPLLRGKSFTQEPLIFLCKNYSCQAPVTNKESLIRLIENQGC